MDILKSFSQELSKPQSNEKCHEPFHFYFVFPHMLQVLLLSVPRSALTDTAGKVSIQEPSRFAYLPQRAQAKSCSQPMPAGAGTTQNAARGEWSPSKATEQCAAGVPAGQSPALE